MVTVGAVINAAASVAGAVGHAYWSKNKGVSRMKAGEYKRGLGKHE